MGREISSENAFAASSSECLLFGSVFLPLSGVYSVDLFFMMEAAMLIETREAKLIRQFVINTMSSSLNNVGAVQNCSVLVAKYGSKVEVVVDSRYMEEVSLTTMIDQVRSGLNYSDLGATNFTEALSFVKNYSADVSTMEEGVGIGMGNGTAKPSSLVLLAGTSGTEITAGAVSLAAEIRTNGTTLMPVVFASASLNESVSTELVAQSLQALASEPPDANLFVCSEPAELLDVTTSVQAQVTTGAV